MITVKTILLAAALILNVAVNIILIKELQYKNKRIKDLEFLIKIFIKDKD